MFGVLTTKLNIISVVFILALTLFVFATLLDCKNVKTVSVLCLLAALAATGRTANCAKISTILLIIETSRAGDLILCFFLPGRPTEGD